MSKKQQWLTPLQARKIALRVAKAEEQKWIDYAKEEARRLSAFDDDDMDSLPYIPPYMTIPIRLNLAQAEPRTAEPIDMDSREQD